ncbi:hypothetical protein [Amycolatopsis sp. NPDC051903]|uniref:hypothetical protein n=1 Tax=Amycolatopsis sp. NPDC051903 TaxID=3363936 RepID=UPI0037A39833
MSTSSPASAAAGSARASASPPASHTIASDRPVGHIEGREHGLLHLPTGHPDPDRDAGEREVAVAPGDLGEREAVPRTRQWEPDGGEHVLRAEVARLRTVEKPGACDVALANAKKLSSQ